MLLLDLPAHIRAHAAIAIRKHAAELRRNGVAVPPELAELSEALWPSAVTSPCDAAEDPLTRARAMAAARTRRYRARKRHQDRQLAS